LDDQAPFDGSEHLRSSTAGTQPQKPTLPVEPLVIDNGLVTGRSDDHREDSSVND
jgi:hypothetical protein